MSKGAIPILVTAKDISIWTNVMRRMKRKQSVCHLFCNLWDFWKDARNHGWGYYPGVEQKDWPIIARQIHQGIAEHLGTRPNER